MSIEKAEILKIDDIFKLNLSIPNYQGHTNGQLKMYNN